MSNLPITTVITKIARKFGLLGRRTPAPDEVFESSAIAIPDSATIAQPPEVAAHPVWLPNWQALIEQDLGLWQEGRRQRKHKVLIGTIAGGHPVCTAMESLIATSLTLRGAEVEFLLCDGVFPTCLQCSADQFPDLREFVSDGPQKRLCSPCFQAGFDAYKPLGLPIRRLSEYITERDRENARAAVANLTLNEIERLEKNAVKLGENANAGALRFFATGDLNEEELGLEVARKFAETGFIAEAAANRLFSENKYDVLFMNHGIYVPHGMLKETAQKSGARTAIWEMAAKSSCIHLNHEDAVFMLGEPTGSWENMNWSEAAENQLMEYLSSRWNGALDWIYTEMHAGSQTKQEEFAREFGIDFSKPTFGLLTNVIWDAALFYPAMAFPSLVDWILETIKYFEERPHFNLVIRVHPAEVRGNMRTRQTAQAEIAKVFPQLPPNVFIVPPESKANTYALMGLCDTAIIYGTTTGNELTSMGIPTICAGQAFIKNKGITLDANTREEYFNLLDQLPLGQRLSAQKRRRARMYAYNYYFRRSIPISFAEPVKNWPPIKMQVDSLRQLTPGANLAIDVICDGILEGKDFLYPAEEVVVRQQAR